MQTQIPVPDEQTKQYKQLLQQPAQLLSGFEDARSEVAQLKDVQVMMNTNSHTENMRVLQAKMHTATQLKTKINHSTADFNYAEGKKDKVGVAMEAWLDPLDPIVGSETDKPQKELLTAVKRKAIATSAMVRGHLLNHDLGGYGVAENLYPITTSANIKHKDFVENAVQKELDKANKNTTPSERDKGNGKGIYYQVQVGNAQLDTDSLTANPVSFICTAKELTNISPSKNGNQGNQLFNTTIVSNTQGVEAKDRGYAHKTGDTNTLPEKVNEKIVPQGWGHGSRKGKENFEDKVNDGSIIIRNTTEIKKIATLISSLQDQLKNLPLDRYASAYEPEVKKVKDAMNNLRNEWSGTELNTKKEIASDILQLLDNYLMKVQGRRPSQVVMVQEMGFTI